MRSEEGKWRVEGREEEGRGERIRKGGGGLEGSKQGRRREEEMRKEGKKEGGRRKEGRGRRN